VRSLATWNLADRLDYQFARRGFLLLRCRPAEAFFRIDVEHIVTNALGLSRVVEQAVASGFLQCSRDGVIRKPL
jgi:hypothetical protein